MKVIQGPTHEMGIQSGFDQIPSGLKGIDHGLLIPDPSGKIGFNKFQPGADHQKYGQVDDIGDRRVESPHLHAEKGAENRGKQQDDHHSQKGVDQILFPVKESGQQEKVQINRNRKGQTQYHQIPGGNNLKILFRPVQQNDAGDHHGPEEQVLKPAVEGKIFLAEGWVHDQCLKNIMGLDFFQ